MNLTVTQIALIRESFRLLKPNVEAASALFYDRLFEIAPQLRSLFRSDITGQGMRFMTTLGVIIDQLDDPQALPTYVENLAQGHAAYGVKPEHFQPMGQALIQTMRETLGDSFPKGADTAWEAAYDLLAQKMIQLAG